MTNVNIFPGNVGIGTNQPIGQLHVGGTDCVLIPKGTTGQRPTSEVDGEIRYNSTLFQYEGWNRNKWQGIGTTNSPYLYDFGSSAFTFTTAGVSGRTGPSLTQLKAAYSPSWTDDTSYLNVVTTGFQLWTVPEDATYRIKAGGARGGQSGGAGGAAGAYAQGDFTFTEGTKLNLIVGQQGQDGQDAPGSNGYTYAAGAGGGASWVLSENKTTLYAVGGGGGGSNSRASNAANYGTNAGQSQAASTARVGTYFNRYSPGGGASWDTNGNGTSVSQGKSIANGAMGGESGHSQGSRNGGFGGGGGNGATQGGGGAGYGGGNCSDYNVSPGAFGGTTRNNGSSTSFGTHTGNDGSVVVTLN
jgi:hypothetical protein